MLPVRSVEVLSHRRGAAEIRAASDGCRMGAFTASAAPSVGRAGTVGDHRGGRCTCFGRSGSRAPGPAPPAAVGTPARSAPDPPPLPPRVPPPPSAAGPRCPVVLRDLRRLAARDGPASGARAERPGRAGWQGYCALGKLRFFVSGLRGRGQCAACVPLSSRLGLPSSPQSRARNTEGRLDSVRGPVFPAGEASQASPRRPLCGKARVLGSPCAPGGK